MTNFKEASFFVRDGVTYYLKDERAREMLAELTASSEEKYGPDNPPPYPVTSVNGQTGAVTVPTVTLPLAVSEGGTGATAVDDAPFVRKVISTNDVYVSASYSNDQPLTIWQNNADNSQRFGLVVAKTYIGLYDTNNSSWVWRTPLMTQSLGAWQINQGGTGATTAASARDNLQITTQNVELLTNSYLNNFTALRNNAGMKFIRFSGYPVQALSANTDYTLGTLSEAYRPTYSINVYLSIGSGSALLTLQNTGIVKFRPFSSLTTTNGINIHYAYL